MNVTFNTLPKSLNEFEAAAQIGLLNPENTCALFIAALNLFIQNKEDGVEAINILRGPRPLSNAEVQFLRDRFIDKPYLPLAYCEGATPQNNYTPSIPYTLKFYPDPRPQDCQPGYMRLYLKTTGADSKRGITLRQKGDNWYLWDYPALLMGIRIPAFEDPWA